MWFLPGLVFVIGYLPILFANIDFYFSADGAKFILNILIQWSATFLAGHGVCNRAAVAAAPAAMGTPYAPAYMPQQQAMPPYGVSPVQMPQHPSSSMPQQAPVRMPQQIAPAAQTQSGQIDAGVFEILRKYKTLLDEGVLTQEEFEAKKRSLLG
ncbi:MAG: SHOCT domain-containing protein [Clostridiales bacterium]|nr:SHOCT domain-containing protein [Clostridiales bacterium]